jgi:hypothetical protein
MLEKLGDYLIWVSIIVYIVATLAYALGRRPWDAVYWIGCALINFAVLMLRKR